jgi:hypothetical protein
MDEILKSIGIGTLVVIGICIVLYFALRKTESKSNIDEIKKDIREFHPNIIKMDLAKYDAMNSIDNNDILGNYQNSSYVNNLSKQGIEEKHNKKIHEEINRIMLSSNEMLVVSKQKLKNSEEKKKMQRINETRNILFLSNAIKYSEIIYSIFDGKDSIRAEDLSHKLKMSLNKSDAEISSLIVELSHWDYGIIQKRTSFYEIDIKLRYINYNDVICYEDWKSKNGK